MSISKQIILSSTLVGLLALFAGYVGYRNMSMMNTGVDKSMTNSVDISNALRGVQANLFSLHNWFLDQGEEKDFLLYIDLFKENTNSLDALGQEHISALHLVRSEYLQLKFEQGEDTPGSFYKKLRLTTSRGEEIIRRSQAANSNIVINQSESLKKYIADLSFWIILICVCIFFMAIIFGQVIAFFLSKSLASLENAAANILNGKVAERIDIEANNEFGYLAKSFNQLADSAEQSKIIEEGNVEMLRLNKELKLKNDSLDSFVYRVSHDLKAPLINLVSLQNVIKRQLSDKVPPNVLKSIDFMESNTTKLQRTIFDLLEVSRIEREVKTEKEKINLFEIIQEVIEENGEVMESTQTSIDFNLEVENIFISRPNIKSIFANIITNAIKYRRVDVWNQIVIQSKIVNDDFILMIKDNGIGIDLEKHGQKLFGIFNRFHNHVEGSGVGLYIVKKVVDDYGGNISVDSQVNIGTTFKLSIPLNELGLKVASKATANEF